MNNLENNLYTLNFSMCSLEELALVLNKTHITSDILNNYMFYIAYYLIINIISYIDNKKYKDNKILTNFKNKYKDTRNILAHGSISHTKYNKFKNITINDITMLRKVVDIITSIENGGKLININTGNYMFWTSIIVN